MCVELQEEGSGTSRFDRRYRHERIQHCLNFLPLPQGQRAFRGTLSVTRIVLVAVEICEVSLCDPEMKEGVERGEGSTDSRMELVVASIDMGLGRCSNVAQ